jgi:Polyketide cyclase / dehydrase and lipid transport
MTEALPVDADRLREEVKVKCRQVATAPDATYYFHTGRVAVERLGYDMALVDSLPDRAVESFAGVGNPFEFRALPAGERVVGAGSGAGFDSFIATRQVGDTGSVVGFVDLRIGEPVDTFGGSTGEGKTMGGTGSLTGSIPQSPNDVVTFLSDIDRLPDWNMHITKVLDRPDAMSPGVQWVVEMKALGNSWPSRSKVQEYDPAGLVFAYRSCTDDGNPSYASWRWIVEPAAEGGSRVTVSWDLNPATFWRRVLLARIRAHQLRREVPASIDALARAFQESAA